MNFKKIINLDEIIGNFNHYEIQHDKYEGSFIEITNNQQQIKVTVDRFSTIPFYYYVFKSKIYGSTSFQDLINKKPKDFNISLNEEACLFFLKTNTFLNDQTLVNEISRIPYGCSLSFNKKSFKLDINRYWNFSPHTSLDKYKNLLSDVNEKFQSSIKKCLIGKKNIGVNISGGYDSRQLLGYLIDNEIKFTGYNYGPANSLDAIVAKELSENHNFKLVYKKWENIKFYKQNFFEYAELTDYMLAFHHFHPFNILSDQKNEDIILYGHFLDFHSQAWKYQGKYENLANKNSVRVIANDFNLAGHFSVLDNKVQKKMFSPKFQDFFMDTLIKELTKLNYLPAEKLYDAFYFLHHGTRRLLPQVQAASKKIYYALPGLNTLYFDAIWSVPGKFKKKNKMRQDLLKKYYQNVCSTRLVRDDQIDYIGKKYGVNFFYKIMKILKHKKFGLLKSDYDFWGEQIYEYIGRDLKYWINSEIENNAMLDYNFLQKDEFLEYYSEKRLPLSSYGTSVVISNFIKRNF